MHIVGLNGFLDNVEELAKKYNYEVTEAIYSIGIGVMLASIK